MLRKAQLIQHGAAKTSRSEVLVPALLDTQT
jgi:hypothetical protein